MAFSRRHYRFVSPRDNTPAEIEANRQLDAVLAQVRSELAAKRTGTETVEQFAELLDWQSERIYELRRERGI